MRIENTPGTIELTVRPAGGEMLIHLLNHNGVSPRPYRTVMPQENLTLRVASGGVRSARARRANLDCETWQDGDDTLIRLPRLDEFEVLRLKQEKVVPEKVT